MAAKVEEYIRFRRDHGTSICRSLEYDLKSFGKFADTHDYGHPLTVKLALKWATQRNCSRRRKIQLLNHLNSLAKYLIIDEPRTQLIPPILGSYPRWQARKEPYIFSIDEIVLLMKKAESVPVTKGYHITLSTIIGVLACTGLRIGEVIRLEKKDVDLDRRLLIVRDSKNRPSRLIPFDETMATKLKEYEEYRNLKFSYSECDNFFVNKSGKVLVYQNISKSWRNILRKTAIGKNHRCRPRMHDLRHTFACRHLLRTNEQNLDMDIAIHSLSVYLGHTTLRETYWYVTAIPELMQICSKRFETHVAISRKKEKK